MAPESQEEDIYEPGDHSDSDDESDPLASGSDHEVEQETQEEAFGASIEDLIDEARGGRRRRHRRTTKRRPNEVPPHLTSVMGSATMAYMTKQYDEAEASLRRVIAEAPRAAAPYRTLGLIQEERGETDEARETFMTAAELDRQDRDLWKRVAAMWDEAGDPEKAIMCLTQALKGTYGGDAEALRGRGVLLMKVGKHRRAADSFVKLAKLVPGDVEVAKMLSTCYRKVHEPQRAVPTVEAMIRASEVAINTGRGAPEVLEELIEILVLLRIVEGKYYDASLLLTRLQNKMSGQPMTFVQRLMLAICQHRLGSPALALSTFKEFMASPTLRSKHRELLSQVADATRESGDYKTAVEACSLLLELDDIDPENRAEIYLQTAVCHKEIGNSLAAKKNLECVLAISPRHVEASLRIQEFLPAREVEIKQPTKRRKRASSIVAVQLRESTREREEALDALQLGDELFSEQDYNGYLKHIFCALQTALRLGGSNAVDEDDNDEEEKEDGSSGEEEKQARSASEEGSPAANRRNNLWISPKFSRSEKMRLHSRGASVMKHIAEEEFVQIAERVLFCFQHVGLPEQAHALMKTFYSLSHLRVKHARDQRRRLRMLNIITSLAVGDLPTAYEFMRLSLLELPQDPGATFAYSTIEQLWGKEDLQRIKSFRYLMRLVKKYPTSVGLCFIAGNCSSRGGLNIRRYTVGIYLQALRLAPHHPLVCLCLAIQVVYVAMGRRISNRNEMLMYALGFLDDYCRNRKTSGTKWLSMEADYNVGRVMHQLGIVHLAADMYQRVLTSDYGQVPPEMDVRRDAAYNLIQIYRQSNNVELAMAICSEYLQY